MSQSWFEIFAFIMNIVTVFFNVAVFYGLWNIFFHSAKEKITITAGVILLFTDIFLRILLDIPIIVSYMLLVALILAYSVKRYGKHCERAVLAISMYYGFRSMAFLVSNSLYQYMCSAIAFANDIEKIYLYIAIAFGIFYILYMVLFGFILFVLWKQVKFIGRISWYDVCFLSVLNIAGGLFVNLIVDISMVQMEKEIFYLFSEKKEVFGLLPAIGILLFLGELSAITIYQKYTKLQMEREKHFMEQQQVKAMKSRLEEAEGFYGSIRKIRHEMRSHMTTIKGLVAAEHYPEVEKYIEKLDESIGELEFSIVTGNAVTDVIINDMHRKAQESEIRFEVDFTYKDTDRVSVFDLGIILHNLLDNAIEACRKVDKEKRYVRLFLKHKNDFLLLTVENSFDGEIKNSADGFPQTVKDVSLPEILMEHGVGLRNVSDIAEQYLGTMDIKAKGGVFKVMVMLQQPK